MYGSAASCASCDVGGPYVDKTRTSTPDQNVTRSWEFSLHVCSGVAVAVVVAKALLQPGRFPSPPRHSLGSGLAGVATATTKSSYCTTRLGQTVFVTRASDTPVEHRDAELTIAVTSTALLLAMLLLLLTMEVGIIE